MFAYSSGSMNKDIWLQYLETGVMPLWPDMQNVPGKRVCELVDGGPGKNLFLDNLKLAERGFDLFPTCPNLTSIGQEMDRLCGGSDRVGVVVVLRAPVKWSPLAAAGCVEPSLRPRVRGTRWLRVEPSLRPRVRVQLLYSCTLVRNQGQPHFFILRAGSLSPPAQVAQAESLRRAGSLSPPTRSPEQNSADRWLLATGY
eukprot:COSAG01_NODE_237_length_20722_cov_360.895747_15_plen_199_part_00